MSKKYFVIFLESLVRVKKKKKSMRCGVLLRVSGWEFSKFVLVCDYEDEQSPLIHQTLGQ